MPHKPARNKNRKANQIDDTNDKSSNARGSKITKNQRNKKEYDDTPRAFSRMMARSTSLKSRGKVANEADNNSPIQQRQQDNKSKNQKVTSSSLTNVVDKDETSKLQTKSLVIQPGERLSEFSRRVDEALPLGRVKSGQASKYHAKKQRKKDRALAKEVKERGDKSSEEEEDDDDDNGQSEINNKAAYFDERFFNRTKRSGSPDPWSKLDRPPPPKFGEVAPEPPKLHPPIRKTLNVPKAAGSLARRSVLESERQRIIDQYRKKFSSPSSS